MTKKIRDFLFKLFIVLFVIITTILSLYATGYRFNLSWPLRFDKMLLKTGTLALDTLPKGATVTLSSETKISTGISFFGSKKDKVTPVKIKNLLPGEYIVSFSLDNYWPYQKKLRVNPEQTTFLEDVVLFRKSLPLNVLTTDVQDISYSPNGKYAWLKNDNTIVNLETEQIIKTDLGKKINWLNDGKQISDGSKIINLENGSITDYTSAVGQNTETQLINESLIYQNNNNLAALNIKTKASDLISVNSNILNYKVLNNTLFIVTSSNNETEVKVFDLKTKKFTKSAKLLSSKTFSFKLENSNLILLDDEHKIAYLLDTTESEQIIKDIIRGATIFKWLDNNKLVYANESEIYIYDVSQTKSYLITRLSEKINSISWSTENYLIYATDKSIGTINLINSGNDITVLWQGEKISSLYFNNKSGVLYFSGSIGQLNGLYKMAIK